MSTAMKRAIYPVLLLMMLCLLAGCGGPKPALDSYKSAPPTPGSDQPYIVDAVVTNNGGSGQVAVVVNLIDKQTGKTLAQLEKDVSLEGGETQHVPFSIDLPLSAQDMDPSNIEVDVEAHYPIE